ncbi:MAG TPA: hypothetical protein VFO37_06250 [Chitinophagaceae bacterium]|nr:hypothetical protein [Chitinophagaceae bacterium]
MNSLERQAEIKELVSLIQQKELQIEVARQHGLSRWMKMHVCVLAYMLHDRWSRFPNGEKVGGGIAYAAVNKKEVQYVTVKPTVFSMR